MTTLTSSPPSIKFLFAHPAHFLALGFGSGLAKKAPGTFGTLLGVLLAWPFFMLPVIWQAPVLFSLFLLGVWCCDKTGRALGVADHGSIVWDEIIAIILVLGFTPMNWLWWLGAFVLFRLFDIWKPFPIRQLDARMKNGFGVMLDDILAAIYSIVCILALLIWTNSTH
jgi:phosphatidylglycerophosphatase A